MTNSIEEIIEEKGAGGSERVVDLDFLIENVPAHAVFVLKHPPGMPGDTFDKLLGLFADDVAELGQNAMVVGVPDFNDIRILNEEQMEELGWVRKERVLAFMDEPLDDIGKRAEFVDEFQEFTREEWEKIRSLAIKKAIWESNPDAEGKFPGLDPSILEEE